VHIAPACPGSREGSDHFGSYVRRKVDQNILFINTIVLSTEILRILSLVKMVQTLVHYIHSKPSRTSMIQKGSLVHVAPACVGTREGSDHFGSYVRNISLHFYKRL
jgi:hypothetical protein